MNEAMANSQERSSERLATKRTYRPEVDIVELEDKYILAADIPGSRSDAINIDLEDKVLTITAKVDDRYSGSTKARFLARDFGLGDYVCKFEVNEPVDQENVSAEYKNGVLQVTIPKALSHRPRKIQVKSM